ncbi:MAG: hypothetical protein JSV84_09750 [Gemmatimonadota bacterium]|nr:MAG: hypothetical protein JSV84_09750 [Gemmatimonadota bacterium]
MGETSFLLYLTPDDRIRHYHFSVKEKITEFAIQYETLIVENWHPVIRYDTAHGFAHLDRMHPDGSVEKVPLLYWDYNEALTFAQHDIKSNWEWYRERYKKEMGK